MDRSKPTGLAAAMEATLQRRQAQSARRALTLAPPAAIDFSSNDFLSWSTLPQLRQAFADEFARQAHRPLASGGSRLLDGNSAYAEDIEAQLAAFHRAPAGLLFNSGFDANTGFFSCVPQPGDVVLYDEFIHASVHEGMRLSRAGQTLAFAHNSPAALRALVRRLAAEDPRIAAGQRNVFVAVEAVYSMDGDVAPLAAMLDVLDALLPHANGHLVVDEAHSTGVFGPHGRGLVCAAGLQHRIFARLHTFGKALAANGAILLCSSVTRDYLVNYARSLIYTTAMGLPALCMIQAVYTLLQQGVSAQPQAELWHLARYLDDRFSAVMPAASVVRLSPSPPTSPIFSLLTQHPRALAAHCQARGLTVRPIVAPTVPAGAERVRVCLHAANTEAHVDALVAAVREWVDLQPGHELPPHDALSKL